MWAENFIFNKWLLLIKWWKCWLSGNNWCTVKNPLETGDCCGNFHTAICSMTNDEETYLHFLRNSESLIVRERETERDREGGGRFLGSTLYCIEHWTISIYYYIITIIIIVIHLAVHKWLTNTDFRGNTYLILLIFGDPSAILVARWSTRPSATSEFRLFRDKSKHLTLI